MKKFGLLKNRSNYRRQIKVTAKAIAKAKVKAQAKAKCASKASVVAAVAKLSETFEDSGL